MESFIWMQLCRNREAGLTEGNAGCCCCWGFLVGVAMYTTHLWASSQM